MSDLLPMKRPEVFQGIPDKIDLTVLEAALSAVKNPKTGRPFYTGRVGRLRFTEEHRAAIRAFQKSINEPETGLFKRNSVTHRKLSEAARRALRNLPKQPRARLTFDGAALKWHGGRFNGKSWKAVSGARGYQKKEFQYVADKGPIPEGKYILKKDHFNHARDMQWWELLVHMEPTASAILGGLEWSSWPGGGAAWGMHRIWVHPAAGNDLQGRSGFSIHGGTSPGSAGCIDLTDQMKSFMGHFLVYGQDLELTVKYP